MKFFVTLFVILTVTMLSTSAEAGIADLFNGSSEKNSPVSNELSDCGKAVATFRKFQHDGRICKKDDDCESLPGFCPVGCAVYINKTFEGIITKRMDDVREECSDSVCPYKCNENEGKPACIDNRCQAAGK